MSTVLFPAGDDAPVARTGSKLVALHGHDAWVVTSGYMNVFATPAADQQGAGRRHHLFQATVGAVLFGLPPSQEVAIEAVGTEATVVTPAGREAIESQLRDPNAGPKAIESVEWWVSCLCEYVAGTSPSDCVGCAAGQEVRPPHNGCVRPASGVLAVEAISGAATLFGRDVTLAEGELVLLSSRAWLHVGETGALRFRSLSEIVEQGEIWRALATLHRAALAGVAHQLRDTAASERTRFAARMVAAAAARASALGTIAATFHGVALETLPSPQVTAVPHDRLNEAARLVAGHMGIVFRRPPAREYRSNKEGVENIARASSFRARHVRLEAEWWRQEQGPLLGFVKGDNRPVALLPRGRAGYELVSPDGSPPLRIDAAVAATLAPRAVLFYRPFPSGPVTLLTLLRFGFAGCRREVGTVLVAGIVSGVVGMGVPIVTGILVNSIIPATDRSQLTQWTLVLIVCATATAMCHIARSIALIRLEMKLGYAIQAAVWDRLVSLPARFFRGYTAGNLATRAMGIDSVRQTLSGATIRGMLAGIFSVFNFALLFYYNLYLALSGTALISVALTVFVTLAYLQRQQQREVASTHAKTNGVVLQLLTGIRKLRVAGAEMRALGTWARLFSRSRNAQFRISRLGTMWSAFSVMLPLMASVVLFSVLRGTESGDTMKTGDFLAFMAAFNGCVGAMMMAAGAAIGALSVLPQYELAKPILQTPSEVAPGQIDPGALLGEIAFDRVVFRYDPEAPPVLNDLTFRVKPGEFVAFVGPSGSGKSTILRLLLGFEAPQSGAVSYDSCDLKDLDIRAVRYQIGTVLQSGKLLPGDIYTNIVGCSSATMEDALRASRMAAFDADLKQMPMGMHTMITDGGTTLSGGQRQRLMIARAIVAAPRILFLDEATSALDNQTQATVSQSLESLRATRVVIAHRLSTIINADRIYVIEKGRIVQSGTYRELMAQPGRFRELASRQLA